MWRELLSAQRTALERRGPPDLGSLLWRPFSHSPLCWCSFWGVPLLGRSSHRTSPTASRLGCPLGAGGFWKTNNSNLSVGDETLGLLIMFIIYYNIDFITDTLIPIWSSTAHYPSTSSSSVSLALWGVLMLSPFPTTAMSHFTYPLHPAVMSSGSDRMAHLW